MSVVFYPGLHHPADAAHFPRACLSVRTLMKRRKPIPCPDVLLDSGAFTELSINGEFHMSVAKYAAVIRRLAEIIAITAAVTQDFMCEPFMIAKTGLTIADHQRLTIERYDALLAEQLPVSIMPVLQGYDPADYQRHVVAYGSRLAPNAWVGVGSVCKRNGAPEKIVGVLSAIHALRPDLRLHGFGVKLTALAHSGVRHMLFSADSMAWSYRARIEGRNPNDPQEARAFCAQIEEIAVQTIRPWQMPLPMSVTGKVFSDA